MLRFENVATPFTGVAVFVPASVPPLGLAPSAMVIGLPKVATVTPASSCAATGTAGEIVLPAVVLVGSTVDARWVAGGGSTGAGLSATTLASQVPGCGFWSKDHVHCGSTAPPLARTVYSPSVFRNPSS